MVEVRRVEAAEVDELGSFGQRKAQQRELWQAMDHLTGVVRASAFGSRADEVGLPPPKVLTPFGVAPFHTHAAGVYGRPLPTPAHTVGNLHTQHIERNPLTLRTRINRLARKTVGLSKSVFIRRRAWPLCESL